MDLSLLNEKELEALKAVTILLFLNYNTNAKWIIMFEILVQRKVWEVSRRVSARRTLPYALAQR